MEITHEDSLSFVSNVLEVKEFEKKFDESKLTVLNKIIWSFHQHIPFNNIKIFPNHLKIDGHPL